MLLISTEESSMLGETEARMTQERRSPLAPCDPGERGIYSRPSWRSDVARRGSTGSSLRRCDSRSPASSRSTCASASRAPWAPSGGGHGLGATAACAWAGPVTVATDGVRIRLEGVASWHPKKLGMVDNRTNLPLTGFRKTFSVFKWGRQITYNDRSFS